MREPSSYVSSKLCYCYTQEKRGSKTSRYGSKTYMYVYVICGKTYEDTHVADNENNDTCEQHKHI